MFIIAQELLLYKPYVCVLRTLYTKFKRPGNELGQQLAHLCTAAHFRAINQHAVEWCCEIVSRRPLWLNNRGMCLRRVFTVQSAC